MGNDSSKVELIEAHYYFDGNQFHVSMRRSQEKGIDLSRISAFLEECKLKRFSSCDSHFFPNSSFYRFAFVPEVCSRLRYLTISSLGSSLLANSLCRVLVNSDIYLVSLELLDFFNPAILGIDTRNLRTLQLIGERSSQSFWVAFALLLRRTVGLRYLWTTDFGMISQSLKHRVIKSLLAIPSLQISFSKQIRYYFDAYQDVGLIEISILLNTCIIKSLVF